MSIHLNQPYKIAPAKWKRYEDHYHIPAERALVVPVRQLGDEVSCEVRWETEDGKQEVASSVVFVNANLLQLNAITDPDLHELWKHYYAAV